MNGERWQYTIYNQEVVGQTPNYEAAQAKAYEIDGVVALAVWCPTLFQGLSDKCPRCGGCHDTRTK